MRPLDPQRKKAIAALARGGRMSHAQIAQRFGVPVHVVDQIAVDHWTDAEVAFLKQNYQTRGPKACSRMLSHSEAEIRRKAAELHIGWRVYRGGKDV